MSFDAEEDEDDSDTQFSNHVDDALSIFSGQSIEGDVGLMVTGHKAESGRATHQRLRSTFLGPPPRLCRRIRDGHVDPLSAPSARTRECYCAYVERDLKVAEQLMGHGPFDYTL